jgi:hypothetical protein
MPTILNSTGFPRTRRPAIYTRVDASALAGGDVESGNIALVGDFPSFKSADPVLFSSRRSMAAYNQADNELALLAQLGFSPSDDPNANNGAASISVVNARQNCIQATIDLGPLTLTSTIYGLTANRLNASLTISNDTHTLALNRNGLSETFQIENEALFNIAATANVELSIIEGALTLTDTDTQDTLISFNQDEAPLISDVVNLLNTVSDITATLVDPTAIKLNEIDNIDLTILNGANADVKAPAYRLKQSLSASNLVTATLDNSDTAVDLIASSDNASGGSQGNALDFEAALASIENENVQIVVLFTDDLNSQSFLGAHLTAAARAGYERQAYTAIDSNSTLAQVKTRAATLNNAGIALSSQSGELIDPKGARRSVNSKHLALIFAGMQAGSDIGEPLTRKRPRLLKVSQQWDNYADAEQALASGTIFVSSDNLGLRIERSISTYLTDNNPIYSEISAYESIIVSLRDVRQALADQIGRPTRASQLSLISGRVNTRLTAQVRDGIIKAFQNIELEDLGDEVAVSYEVAAVEPLNFITVTAIAQRITA